MSSSFDRREGSTQPARRHPPHHHLIRPHEGTEGAQGIPEPAHRLVVIEAVAAAGWPLAGGKPRLEMHVADLESPLRPVALGVDAADQLAVVQDGQRVVAVHALVAWRVHLDAIGEAEEARDATAVPKAGVEG